MDVGVRELKQNLATYLDLAERGEVITVTERGRPKAQLVPLPGADRLAAGIEEGWITAPRAGASLGPLTGAVSSKRSDDVLVADRDA
jgi:prevent-host-death family protein